MTNVRRRSGGLLPAAAAVLVILTGCTSGDGSDDSAGEPSESATSSSPSPPKPEPPPPENGCYRLRPAQLSDAHTTSPPVKCGKSHTSQTYLVGNLSKATIGDPEAIRTEQIAHAAEARCTKALPDHLGANRKELALSRVDFAWFVPDEEQFARGARWLRCDIVAYKKPGVLAQLPHKTADLLGSEDAFDRWGTCAKASTRGLEAGRGQRMCAVKHNWRAVSTQRLGTKKDPWPGAKAVRKNVLDHCEEAVRSFTDNETETADVGWLPPTKSQWQSGRHYGICWAETG